MSLFVVATTKIVRYIPRRLEHGHIEGEKPLAPVRVINSLTKAGLLLCYELAMAILMLSQE